MYRPKSTAVLAASCLWFILSAPAGADSPTSPKFGTWGFDVSGMDRSASPGADFYKYANGNWEERTAIPQDRSLADP